MQNKVIFITLIPFMNQHVTDMYVDSISKEFQSEIWDLSKTSSKNDVSANTYDGVKKIESYEELDNCLKEQSKYYKTVIVTNILNAHLGKLYQIAHKYGIPLICINKESFNSWLFEQGTYRYRRYFRLKARVQAIGLHFPITRYAINCHEFGKYKYDYLLASQNYYKMQCKHFVKIHHVKYDEYLLAEHTERTVKGKYILFVDAGPSSHPAFCNRANSLDQQEYLKRINNYMDYIERNMELPIVISAHPKAQYEQHAFNGRPIFVGNTAELIHNSEAVISHYSTSLVNAVLERKPIQVVYYEDMFTSAFRGSIIMGLEFAEMCNADICDMDHPHAWTMTYSSNMYQQFLKQHVYREDAMSERNSTLIARAIKQIFEDRFE